MVMFSELRRFRVRDQDHHEARLTDLALDLSAAEYPRVTKVFFRRGVKRHLELPWSAVKSIDWRLKRINVTDLEAGQAAPHDALQRTVLIDRDMMDALILDMPARQSMRANDLWLYEEGGALFLRAADISPWAVLRRLGRGFLGHGVDRRLLDWRDVEFLRGDPQAARDGRDYHRRVALLHAAEIAHLLDAVPYLHAAELLTLIPDPLAADTLEVMAADRQVQVFEELPDDQQLRLLQLMAPNNVADLLGRLGPDRAKQALNALPANRREPVIDLLRYPEDTAGGIMTNDVVMVRFDLDAAGAREEVRDKLADPDFVYYLYVVDDLQARRLQGVLTLRDLLLAQDTDAVRDLMRKHVDTLDPLMSASAAARHVADQHLAALPVVSKDGRLLGAVTADAALLQLSPASAASDQPRVFT
jgi:CBS domain-containing protein